jgi:hypothetical protein
MICNKFNSAMRLVALLVFCLLHPSFVFPQEKASNKDKEVEQVQASILAPPVTPRPALAFGLVEDTPVRLRLIRTMSSKDATMGEKVDFEVVEDVKIGEVVVIRQGAMAIATVTEAQHKRRMGRAGKLNMNIDYAQLVSGEKVSLRAIKGGKGGNRTAAMTGALVASGILFFPAAPFFLFMHGKDITVPKGTEVTAYIAADTSLDPAKFASQETASSSNSNPEGSTNEIAGLATVLVKSTPDASDITIDGKFVGSTTSTLRLAPGEHTILIEKSGFKSWQRSISVSSNGRVTVDATLEKVQ